MGWIGVDLDGTAAEYDGWRGMYHIGKPIAPMWQRINTWLDKGIEVKIFTARVAEDPNIERCIHLWMEQYGLPRLPVTNVKDFGMMELWDDRAVRVRHNTGEKLSPSMSYLDYLAWSNIPLPPRGFDENNRIKW